MFYTNIVFVILFIFLTLLIRVMPFALRKYVLILASLFVIATWGWGSLLIFLMVAMVGYIIAGLLSKQSLEESRLEKRRTLIIGITFNLLLLILFKYRDFLFGSHLASMFSGPLTQIGVPLGISFYSFHIISYLVDIYHGKYTRAGFFDYLFYLSFFPHVIAGPIVRGWQLLPQTTMERKTFTRDLLFGSHLFITGFFLKTVCADNIGFQIDPYWKSASPVLGMTGHWSVALFYYFQLYGDFAGYSLMACGMARLLGYRLPMNFKAPMRAVGFQDFWRRWHITLSRFLRDYLYIPLGGNQGTITRTCVNLLIVMALGGLWHGAAWTFLVWGLLHGTGLLVERIFKLHRITSWGIPMWWLVSQILVLLAWVFFRSPSLSFAVDFIHHMFIFSDHLKLDPTFKWIAIYTLPLILHHFAPTLLRVAGPSKILPILGASTGMMLLATLIVQSPPTVFIYFAF